MATTTRIQLKRDTAANWLSSDLSLLLGEFAYDTTNRIVKIGNGVNTWGDLPSLNVEGINNVVGLADVLGTLSNYTDTQVGSLSAKVGDIPDTAVTATTVIGYINEQFSKVSSALRFKGAFSKNEGETDLQCLQRNIPTPENGDVALIIDSSAEYVYCADLSGTAKAGWEKLGDEQLYATKAELADTVNTVSSEIISTVNTVSSEIISAVNNISVNLEGQIATAETNAKTYADTKVYVNDGLSSFNTLSVMKVTPEEYAEVLKSGTKLSGNSLYIVDEVNLNAYGQKVINVAAPTLSNDAATKQYVDDQVATSAGALSGVSVNGVPVTVTNKVAEIDLSILDCGTSV